MAEVKMLKLKDIEVSDIALRGVNTEGEQYKLLKESLSSSPDALLTAIAVNKTEDGYVLIDGLQRFTAFEELGYDEIPAVIKQLGDTDILAAQIVANSKRVETKPIEFTKGIIEIFKAKPEMTMSGMCQMLSCSREWLNKRLSLLKLANDIQPLVNENKINLTNAFMLAKLPEDKQKEFLDAAINEPASAFGKSVVDTLNEMKKEKRGSKTSEFVYEAKIRKLSDIKALYDDKALIKDIVAGCNNAIEGGNALIDWIMQMDEKSIADAKAHWEQVQADKAARAAEAKRKREEAKKQEAIADAN